MLRTFDPLLEHGCFFGFENTGDGESFVNCGHGFGAVPHHDVVRQARDLYEQLSFKNEDSSLNLLASPYYTTQTLRAFGLIQNNCDQSLTSGIQIYSSDVLCPKTFRTGKLHKTSRTVSIHHFSASWVDEQIKSEIKHQQNVQNLFGKRLGSYVLYAESVFQKYTAKEFFTVLPRLSAQKLKGKLLSLHDAIPYYRGLAESRIARPGTGAPIILDTGMDSDNAGDNIIMENCMLQLADCMVVSGAPHIPTHRFPTEDERSLLKTGSLKILCGTNILSGHMRTYGLWKLGPQISLYQNTILMGVGFNSNDISSDFYTRQFFRTILSSEGIHSVRDSFSEQKLKSMGIQNVLNTGCPTMWNLTPEHCAKIPATKATDVICTVTDYNRDEKNDRSMLDILLANYRRVYLWLQGRDDLDYVRSLGYEDKLALISSGLDAYDAVLALEDLDYVGTRLHAGIRALSKGRRSLIISIDNRAECIAADTGLPIIHRKDVPFALERHLYDTTELNLVLPWENIENWKSQIIWRYLQ